MFQKIVRRNAERAGQLWNLTRTSSVSLGTSAFDQPPGKVDLIITSPPYLGAQKYVRSSSLSLGWLDFAYEGQLRAIERETIGREHFSLSELGGHRLSGIEAADRLLSEVQSTNPLRAHIAWTYLQDMREVLKASHRALKPRGNLILVSGPNTIAGHLFDTPQFLQQLAHDVGFATRFKLVDDFRSR